MDILIIGCGLIGASLAAGLSAAKHPGKVFGYARRAETVIQASRSGWFESVSSDLQDYVAQADVVVLCVPLSAVRTLLVSIAPYLKPDAVITDVVSVKSPIVELARTHVPEILPRIVPGHPIAGSEKSGFEAAKVDLFHGHRVILTPLPETEASARAKVTSLWKTVHAEVVSLSVEMHDRVLAASSHLPHLVAFSFVEALFGAGVANTDIEQIAANAAGGLRDFTRIAESDPVMWRDILVSNRAEIVRLFGKVQQKLDWAQRLLSQAQLTETDEDELLQFITSASLARQAISHYME